MSEQLAGAARELGGRVQQTVGDLTGDGETRMAGLRNQAVGQAQQTAALFGDAIKAQPIAAVVVAAGIGYLLGRLTA